MKYVMIKLIGPKQSSFVFGKYTMENVVIYQEKLHSMKTYKRKVRYMAIKIDLEKAYDRFNWSFIELVLSKANFPLAWIKNIMKCVGSLSMLVI